MAEGFEEGAGKVEVDTMVGVAARAAVTLVALDTTGLVVEGVWVVATVVTVL